MKEHQFIVTVRTPGTKASALSALLCAFGVRQPDGCEFHAIDFKTFQRRRHARIMKMCDESRKRMNAATPEQRAELHAKAMEIIARGRSKIGR